MLIDDDRTTEERETLRYAVVGTDPFMSNWGKAEHGASYAAWAVDGGHIHEALGWAERRGDIKRIRVVVLDDYRPRAHGHLHIYTWKGDRFGDAVGSNN